MFGAAAIAALPPPEAPPVAPVGAGGRPLTDDEAALHVVSKQCFVCLESPVLSAGTFRPIPVLVTLELATIMAASAMAVVSRTAA